MRSRATAPGKLTVSGEGTIMVKDKSAEGAGKGKGGYDVVLSEVVGLLEEARRSAVR